MFLKCIPIDFDPHSPPPKSTRSILCAFPKWQEDFQIWPFSRHFYGGKWQKGMPEEKWQKGMPRGGRAGGAGGPESVVKIQFVLAECSRKETTRKKRSKEMPHRERPRDVVSVNKRPQLWWNRALIFALQTEWFQGCVRVLHMYVGSEKKHIKNTHIKNQRGPQHEDLRGCLFSLFIRKRIPT